MACDICGKVGSPLTDLREIYRTPEIVDICPDCQRVVNKKLRDVQTWVLQLQAILMKRFMKERRAQLNICAKPSTDQQQPARRGWVWLRRWR